ncbi:ATP-dependent RNA helicase DDX49/DBP8 [Entomortierella parvispora]|uniref:ATP-dependent RNA helicase DDX49/DBP8 n=1 Tax=Entomortierella parvispora TaxID=205924 RepID=A0A9P3LU72_9FUNG|nr:ATP-dependent RNA helicase DDX49/DBP8 [Entomortierella parvispora]
MAKASTSRPNKKQKAEAKEERVVLPDPISDEEDIEEEEEEEEGFEDEEEAELEEESDEADQDNEDDEQEQEEEGPDGESEHEEEEEEEEEVEEEEEEEEFKSSLSFSQLGLASWLVNALKAMSITSPSEIQTKCIPQILAGKDVIGGAKTGSGKTAAFALPILQKLSEDPYGVFAVVLTPTRELAFQIAEQFNVLGKTINLKDVVVVGGLDMMTQAIALSKRPHIIIATPGRLRDHINSSGDAMNLSKVKFLVLDEADRLLTETFAEDLGGILEALPQKRQTLLFTATMTDAVLELAGPSAESSKPAPFVYQCKTAVSTVKTLTQSYIFIPSHMRETYLAYLLRSEDFAKKSTIIFTGRCRTAETLRVMLRELGIACTALHSEMSQQERLNSLAKFRGGITSVLIATDVGSRGLDIPSVLLVLNYDIPRDPTDYIHRVGRTARAGRGGQAISMVSERDIQLVHDIESRINKTMAEFPVPETKALDLLNEVTSAKRAANMSLHDSQFGEKRRIQKQKREALSEARKGGSSKRKSSSK